MGKYEYLKTGLIYGITTGIGLHLISLYEAMYDVPFLIPFFNIGGTWLWFAGWTIIIGIITAIALKQLK